MASIPAFPWTKRRRAPIRRRRVLRHRHRSTVHRSAASSTTCWKSSIWAIWTLDQTLTSRDVVNTKMRAILDEATDPWGIKVNRVELKNILPPQDIQNSMEKQMKAERDRLSNRKISVYHVHKPS